MTKFKDIIFEKNVAIHCTEEWMANELLEYADSRDYVWISGKRYTEHNNWNYKHNNVYIISRGTCADISYAGRNYYKILHYNDVVIKEEGENNMETKLTYELTIKGRKAKIGSKLFLLHYGRYIEVVIETINIDGDVVNIFVHSSNSGFYGKWLTINREKDHFDNVNDFLFWEKPIIYQLPDTEGNLSEVKVGQKIYDNDSCEFINISDMNNNRIEARDNSGGISVFNIRVNNSMRIPRYTINKPKRDFSPYFDFNQAPNGYDFGAVDEGGYAYWYNVEPEICVRGWNSNGGQYKDAGFRQNLISPETGYVDDWKDSLVERPKGKKNV